MDTESSDHGEGTEELEEEQSSDSAQLVAISNTEDAIRHTRAIREVDTPDLTRVMGTPWPPFINPNITGDLALTIEHGNSDYTDLQFLMQGYNIYPIDFRSPLNTIGETADNEVKMLRMIGGPEVNYLEELRDAAQGFNGNCAYIIISKTAILSHLMYNKSWEKVRGRCFTGRAARFETSRDISLPVSPHEIFKEQAHDQGVVKFVVQIGAESYLIGRYLRDYGIRVEELCDPNSTRAAEVVEKVKIEIDTDANAFLRGTNSLYFDFFWLCMIYFYWRTHYIQDKRWRDENKVKPRDLLACWNRQDPLQLCDSLEERMAFGKLTDAKPEPDELIESYEGETDGEHDTTVPFFLHPTAVPPRRRTKDNSKAALHYVKLLCTGNNEEADILLEYDLDGRRIVDKEYHKNRLHGLNQEFHLGSDQKTLRETIERERAPIAVRSLLVWLSQLEYRYGMTDAEVNEMIFTAAPQKVFEDLAAIECLEYLYYGFVRSSVIALGEQSYRTTGFIARVRLGMRRDPDGLCLLSFTDELQRPVPETALRPVKKEEAIFESGSESEEEFIPQHQKQKRKERRDRRPDQDEVFHQAGDILGEQQDRVELKSMPLADEKNESVDCMRSVTISFLEDYELLPIMLRASEEEDGLKGKRIKLNKVRYGAKLQGSVLKVYKKIKGAKFLALSFQGEAEQEKEMNKILRREIAELRRQEALRQRAASENLIRFALEYTEKNHKVADKRAALAAKQLAKVYELIKTMAALKNAKKSKDKLREEIDSRYFAPNRMTEKAMSKLLSSMVDPHASKPKYGLPHLGAVRRHLQPRNASPRSFAADAAKGCRKKNFKEAIEILGGIVNPDDLGDPAAAAEIDEIYQERDREDAEYEPDEVAVTLANRQSQGAGAPVMPLLYSARYTYEVLFYLAQADQNIVYPMGKTYPNLGWVYTALDMIDPKDKMVMRYNPEKLLVSFGGLRLFDAYMKVVSSAAPNITALVARAASVGTSDKNSRYLQLASKTATSLGILYRQASQLKGELKRHKAEFMEEVEEFNNMQSACRKHPLLKHTFNEQHQKHLELIKAFQTNLTTEQIEAMILDRFGLKPQKRVQLEETMYFCEMGFAEFAADAIKALQKVDNIERPAPDGRLYWILNTALNANSTTKHDLKTIEGKHIYWFSLFENFLQTPGMTKPREILIGPPETCNDLLRLVRKAKLYAVENAETIDLFRPAEVRSAQEEARIILESQGADNTIAEELKKLARSEPATAANTESNERAKLLR